MLYFTYILNMLASNIFYIQFLVCHARNKTNLERILNSLVSIIKRHVVYSFLIAVIVVRNPLVCDHTRVIPGSSWPKTNYTLTSMDLTVTCRVIEYYCRWVNLVQSDGVSIIITDEYGRGSGICNESAIVKSVCPAGKHSGTHWKWTNGILVDSGRCKWLAKYIGSYLTGTQKRQILRGKDFAKEMKTSMA